MWEIPKEDEDKGFFAYICKASDGRQVGYIRIGDYNYDEQAVDAFDRLIARFEHDTGALVVDQVRNPGGSMFQMYALLSMLTDHPLALPQHHITITEDDAAVAADVIANADEEPPERVAYSRLVLSERAAGRGNAKRISHPLYLEGVESIRPAKNHYTKRIVVLIDSLTFSAGEFLAAILQDNKRATLFGERTAGAGGCARKIVPPGSDQFGIAYLTLTWTIARRTSGELIEGNGVQPDVTYTTTIEDIQSSDPLRREIGAWKTPVFQGYRRALLNALTAIMNDNVACRLNSASRETSKCNRAGLDVEMWHPSQAQLKNILEQHRVFEEGNGAEGKRADLSGASLAGAELANADLSAATAAVVDLRGADLRDAQLGWANLRQATMSCADLRGSNLSGAYMSGANLKGANLSGANLKGVNLSDADLSDTNLSGADLLDAYLPGADLSGADLRTASGLTADQLGTSRATPQNPPKLPPGFVLPRQCAEQEKATARS